MGCFYCDEHHEGREAIMYKVGEMEAGVLYLFKDQAHKGRCALALKNHRKELCECEPEELSAFARDLARASGAVKALRPSASSSRFTAQVRSASSMRPVRTP